MGVSKIEWTDYTFNAWIGCAKVSAGCQHCYAETLMDRRFSRAKWGVNGTRTRTSAANWGKPIVWDAAARRDGRYAKVFCQSLSDLFEDRDDVAEWRQQAFSVMGQTTNLYWLLLTKRPQNVMRMIDPAWLQSMGNRVWIGTSVEDQSAADERIPPLLEVPAKRFLSVEPLLGPVRFGGMQWGIDWVIGGGESGPYARPMQQSWVRKLYLYCAINSTPFFFKQGSQADRTNYNDISAYSGNCWAVRQFPADFGALDQPAVA